MMIAALFAQSDVLALQIRLDRAGYSCNTIDGEWGAKSASALASYCRDRRLRLNAAPEDAARTLFPNLHDGLFRIDTVTEEDLASIVAMPKDPADKALMGYMGYSSLKELFAERGHLSTRAIERLNPEISDWNALKPGDKVRIADFPFMEDDLDAWPRKPGDPDRPLAALVHISLSRREISVYDKDGRRIFFFPCSIAKSKSNLPAKGVLEVATRIANPNYTFTPDKTEEGKKPSRHILPPGPRNPVGVAWMGLDLPRYGIHGTPYPESVGRAESHGCFRLSNWNAARLYSVLQLGTKVVIAK